MSTATVPRRSLAKIKDEVEFRLHQVEGVRQMAKMSSFILGDEMGLGKSLQALTVAAIDFEQGWAKRVLIVAPATLKWNWVDEMEKFTHFSHAVLDGTPKKRAQQLAEFDADVLVVNYEQVRPHLDELNALDFDIVIFDEAHALKNPTAKRTKACLKLVARRYFMVTGSPLLNRVNELWTLLHRINPEEFPNYWKFLNRYAVFGGYKDKEIVGVKNQAELKAKLDAVMIRRLKKDVLDLPEKQYITKHVDLHPEQRRLYDQAMNELEIELPGNPDPMKLENALTRFLRLKQLCSTTYAITGEDYSYKLDLAEDLIQEIIDNGDPVVVFTQFRGTLEAMVNRLGKRAMSPYLLHGDVPVRDRQRVVADWTKDATEGRPAPLLAMLQVAGVGLTMTAANTCIFLDKLFVPKLNEQAEDRIHRIGADTTRPVTIIDIVARKTIEQRIEQILRRKKKLFDELVEADDWKRKLYEAMREEDWEDAE